MEAVLNVTPPTWRLSSMWEGDLNMTPPTLSTVCGLQASRTVSSITTSSGQQAVPRQSTPDADVGTGGHRNVFFLFYSVTYYV